MKKPEIKPGSKAGLLDERVKGTVVKVEKDLVWLRLDNGLEIPCPADKVVTYDIPIRPEKKKAEETPEPSAKKNPAIPVKKKPQKPLPSENWEKKPLIRKITDKTFNVNPELLGEKPARKRSKASEAEDGWEVDLHIQELVSSYKHLTNGEIVDIQLRHFHAFIEAARKKRIRKVIVIHGVGSGRLKEEIRHALMRYTDAEYYDASYSQYGAGATEVNLFYGKKR